MSAPASMPAKERSYVVEVPIFIHFGAPDGYPGAAWELVQEAYEKMKEHLEKASAVWEGKKCKLEFEVDRLDFKDVRSNP